MRKLYSIICVICLLIGIIGSNNVYAADNIEVDNTTSNIVVRGIAETTKQNNGCVTVQLRNKSNGLVYLNQSKIVLDHYFIKFKLKDFDDCVVKVYDGKDITDYSIVEKAHEGCFDTKVSLVGDGNNTWFDVGDTIDLKAAIVNLYEDKKDLTVLFAGYDTDGRLLKLEKKDSSIGFGSEGETVDILLNGFEALENLSYVKAFIWENDTQAPVATSYSRETKESTYQDGDVVALVGDSITEVSEYAMLLEHYYQTRYPERNITFYNKGCSGHASYNMVDRFNWDVLRENPNKITILNGFNQFSWDKYDYRSSELQNTIDSTITDVLKYYKKMTDMANAVGAEFTICTPSIYEEPKEENRWQNRNSILTGYSQRLREFAAENNLNCYDVNAFENEVATKAEESGLKAPYLTSGDGIHPYFGCAGGFAIMYGFLRDQKASDTVAAVEINCDDLGDSKFENCKVENINCTDTGLTYQYHPYSIPLAYCDAYKNAEKLFDVSEAINREIIKITGLSNENYNLMMNGQLLGTYSGSELSEGINISVNQSNPNQMRSQDALYYMKCKRGGYGFKDEDGNIISSESSVRTVRGQEGWALSARIDPSNPGNMIEYFKDQAKYEAYLDSISKMSIYMGNMQKYSTLAKEASTPVEVTVSIEKEER